MIYELIIFRVLIVVVSLGCIILLYRMVTTANKKPTVNMVDGKNLSGKDLEEYISKLKELIKKAEDDYNAGIESAEAKLQMYKDQLENVTKIKKVKLEDL